MNMFIEKVGNAMTRTKEHLAWVKKLWSKAYPVIRTVAQKLSWIKNGGRIVVQHRRRDAQEDDADVAHGILQQLRRGVDELQQRGRNESRDQPPAGPRLPPQQLPERPPQGHAGAVPHSGAEALWFIKAETLSVIAKQ